MKRKNGTDNGHPATSICERCHAPKDPRDRYCRNCGRRLDKRPTIDRMAEEADRMCTDYCKWPDLWDEDAEMMPLNESRYCKNCPLTSLLGCAAGKYADQPTLMYGA